jgi:hypothetical protein
LTHILAYAPYDVGLVENIHHIAVWRARCAALSFGH